MLTKEQHIDIYIACMKEYGFHYTLDVPLYYQVGDQYFKANKETALVISPEPGLAHLLEAFDVIDREESRTPSWEQLIRQDIMESEKAYNECRRYLLVNGRIPLTMENVEGLPTFYLGAEDILRDVICT